MPSVTCVKCNRKGSLLKKSTKSKGHTYEYWYVEHWTGTKRGWCYIGKGESLPQSYKNVLKSDTQIDTQTYTQTYRDLENLNLASNSQNKKESKMGRSSSMVGHWLYEPKVAGSSPARPTKTASKKAINLLAILQFSFQIPFLG